MGHRVTRAASHLSADEVKEYMNTGKRPWVRQHWWIIYNALIAPRKAEEIALHTGVSVTTVHQVIATYNRLGQEPWKHQAREADVISISRGKKRSSSSLRSS